MLRCRGAGIDGGEGDARGAVETLVEHVGGHHQGQLGLLLATGWMEWMDGGYYYGWNTPGYGLIHYKKHLEMWILGGITADDHL